MSGDGILVRRVRASEYDEVSRLRVTAYSHDYELGRSTPPTWRTSLGTTARARCGWRRIATAASSPPSPLPPRGAASTSSAGRARLDWRLLAVAPDARGRGLGRLLTEFVVMLATERGLERVVMNSGSDMLAAHALYESMGFTRLPDRENPPGVEPTRTYGLDL